MRTDVTSVRKGRRVGQEECTPQGIFCKRDIRHQHGVSYSKQCEINAQADDGIADESSNETCWFVQRESGKIRMRGNKVLDEQRDVYKNVEKADLYTTRQRRSSS